MRSFIAIELPDVVKSRLDDLQNELKKSRIDIRWVRTDNIHLTLKFLGDIEGEIVEHLIKTIKGTCTNHNLFSVEIRGIGTFPARKTPRVLWAGISDNEDLKNLYADIEKEAASLGFSREKRVFSPHLTLGRFRSSPVMRAFIDKIEVMKHESFGQFDVRSIYLIKSDLKQSGAVYSRQAEFPLGSHATGENTHKNTT